MGFCFKKKESIAKGVRRLSGERTREALECLKKSCGPEAIHGVRKDIKKVRAILRLVRAALPRKTYRRQIKWLRKAANHLTTARDAQARAAALQALSRRFKNQLAPAAWHHARVLTQNSLGEQIRRFAKTNSAKNAEQLLRRHAKELNDLDVAGKGWKAICSGVKASYSGGRRAYRQALRDPTPENLHEWRKRAKDLWYQVRLLRPIWPEQLDAIANELKELTEKLGDDHDLFILRRSMNQARRQDRTFPKWDALDALIEQREHELRTEAIGLGAKFYAEKPAAFLARLAGYWWTWRGEKKFENNSVLV